MMNLLKIRFAVSALVLTAGSIGYGQALPAGGTAMRPSGAGPNLPSLDGVLHYAISGSEIVQFGYFGAGDTTASTAVSGDVSYTGKSADLPFSMLFAGGVILPNESGQGTSYYSSAAVSQGLITRNWTFNISDSVSFLPQSPTVGLSGIAGVGDLGADPIVGPTEGPAGGIFSEAGNRVANSISGSLERQITHDTSISGAAGWSVLHFLDNDDGLDSSQVTGSVSINRRINARSSVSVNANYSTYDFSTNDSEIDTNTTNPDIETRGINLVYSRTLSHTLSMTLSAGPQWVSSSNSTLVPSSLNAAVNASLSYTRGFTNGSLNYSRGVNAGSGVLPGAESDSVSGYVGHTFGRKWVGSMTVAYTHSVGLTQLPNGPSLVPVNETFDTVYGGVQVRRAFSAHLSGYASYSAQNQTSNYSLAGFNALNGTSQTIGVGVTFTPRSTRLGQF
ncbi:MAG: hypothetical protein ABSA39_06985 [Edaphobacter sp.]